jgi:predicted Ser/Thr protein kinase
MQKTIGKYELQRLLGKGSMGEVYLGIDPTLGREVAIKTILAGPITDSEGDGKTRFAREARAMAALNHPNIVTIFDFGTEEGTHYLAMEYLEGDDLATLIDRGTPDKLQLLDILAQATEGLGYAHHCGIVHRDVKPGNILVAFRGKRAMAKLLDFGVASVDRSNLTEKGVWMGTVNYMAPEYLDSGKASPTSDLFAVGVIIYEIVSGGRKPFQGDSTTAILNAILRKAPEKIPEAELRGIPPAVLTVMDKALAKDPAQRYASAEDLADALREALAAPLTPAPEEPRQQIIVGKGGGATCLSLRVAVRQAQPGSVIVILPGLYREAVVVDKELTFQGEGPAAEIVVEAPTGPCLTMDAARCTVRGVTLQNKDGDTAVDLRSGHTALEACVLQQLRVAGGASAVLTNCEVTGSCTCPAILLETAASLTAADALVTNPQGQGLRLQSGAQITAQDTRFEDNPLGSAELGSGSAAQFLRCQFVGSQFAGVLAFEGAKATLKDCLLSGHEGAGLHALGSAQIDLKACRIMDNHGLGVAVVDAARAVLEDCDIAANGQPGLMVHRGGSARLSQCRVLNGKSLGIACHQDGGLALDACVVQGNALGGILLGPGAGAPELKPNNDLQDPVLQG